ncbi:MAG: hypothetical protein LUO95_00025 [Methylococcaceae bacterium]|nr:hypothetical protein [Methylococcaceae bacterium]MDD1616520.1 hypothetical protein [Methylococcaceae bacterium]OYV17510.1 MAG: hypothetical protein CG439_1648 [Methylococcaceae bacterium NSP1-2]
MTAKVFQSIKFILVANFMISVMLLIAGSLLSLSDRYSLFEFNQDLYGELINNVKITLIYIAITEMIICAYCFFSKNTQIFIFVGFFLTLMLGSVYFYGEINDVEMDENLYLFFLYTGLSHTLFGVIANFKKDVYAE